MAPQIDATDSAVELAKERKIDLSGVKGTGAEGRIIKTDVEAAVAANEAAEGGSGGNGSSAAPAPEPEIEVTGTGAPYYCPGCGRRYEYKTECVGTPEGGHKPILVVSTKELQNVEPGDENAKVTAAPNTGEF